MRAHEWTLEAHGKNAAVLGATILSKTGTIRELRFPSGLSSLWGRVHYDDNLIVEEAATVEELQADNRGHSRSVPTSRFLPFR